MSDVYELLRKHKLKLQGLTSGYLRPETHYSNGEVVQHHGIEGQRWGIRRQRGPDGTVKPGSGKPTEDYLRAQELKTKARKSGSSLTNAEMRMLNERLQLEQTFRNLSKRQVSEGEKFAKDVLKETAKQLVSAELKNGGKALIDFLKGSKAG